MGIRKYFSGKTAVTFWLNSLLALAVLIGVPVIVFNMLDTYTNHGQTLTVPSVVGMKSYDAESLLSKEGLVAVISDSTYNKKAEPGTILDQSPHTGATVKKGRYIYLTMNLNGEPLETMPDLVQNCSLREAQSQLSALGFKLSEPIRVEGEPKDLVIKIRQGKRDIRSGEKISKERALTIYAGAGDTEDLDSIGYSETLIDIDDLGGAETHDYDEEEEILDEDDFGKAL